MSGVRKTLFVATLGVYTAIVAAVVSTSLLVRLDWQLMLFRPYKQWPELHAFLDYFVVLGQRGPTAVLIAAWLGWRSWRQHSVRPLLVLGAALLLLNVTVGAAKLGMGREGPHYATAMGSNEMFLTGDIFPSGHTANAVVTWGILAYLASTPRDRRRLSVVAAVFALGVGTTTVYLGTHWVSDVLLGWAAGLLILLALPWCEPVIARVEAHILVHWARLRAGIRLAPVELTPVDTHSCAVARPTGETTRSVPESAVSGARNGSSGTSAARPHSSRQYMTGSAHLPVSPFGNRRPRGERPAFHTAPLRPRK